MKIYFVILLAAIVLYSCGKQEKEQVQDKTKASEIELLGAGATFPFPLYSKMFDTYYQMKNVKVNYQAIGSGGGIRQLMSKTVDFGATDAFMNQEEMNKAERPIIHIPTCLGAVVITYNLKGNPTLKLNSEIISDIFLGKIDNWNNSKIRALNPDGKLPNQKIVVVHRSDGSGTTFIFSDYLAKVSSGWKQKVGRGKSLKWPVGLGGKGNQGVAGLIQQTPGAIGYAELIYAVSNDMPTAVVENKSGNFITPSIKTVSQAATDDIPADTRVSLTNTDAENGYPISSFTWLILYNDLKMMSRDEAHAKELLELLWWMTHDGQKVAEPLHYAPLPDATVKQSEILLKSITYGGKKILN